MKKTYPHTDKSFRFVINIVYAIYNCVLGIISHSWWFITIGAYYIILSTMRFLVLNSSVKNKENEFFIMKFSGCMLFVLSWVLSGIVYMTIKYDVGVKYHEIAMITIAVYAFTKLTLAIIGYIKSRGNNSPLVRTIWSISFTDAVVSIYSLQRSMLVSFEGMTDREIYIFNTLSGVGMCMIVVITGLNLILGKDFKDGKVKISKDE